MRAGGTRLTSSASSAESGRRGYDAPAEAKAEGIGCKAIHPTDTRVLRTGKTEASTALRKLPERQGRLHASSFRGPARVAEAMR